MYIIQTIDKKHETSVREYILNLSMQPTKSNLYVKWADIPDAEYVYACADALHARKIYAHLPKRTCRIRPDNGDASLRRAFRARVCEDRFGIAPPEMHIGERYTCVASCGLCCGNCGQDPMSSRTSAVYCKKRKRAYFKSHCHLNVMLQSSQAYGASALSREFDGSCGATGVCALDEVKNDGLNTGV